MTRSALLLVALLAAGCRREADPAAAAHLFFAQVATGQLDAAFGDSAFFFRKEQTAKEFEAAVRDVGLIDSEVVKTEAPAVAGSIAKMSVTLRATSGREFPLVVTLDLERGAWRVFSVKSPVDKETGMAQNHFTRLGRLPDAKSALDRPMPHEQEIRALATETLLQFNDAIQQRSFEDFYEGVARAWQRQLTLGMLTRTFQGFIDQRTNLFAIKDTEAVLDPPPHLDSDGLLIVSGSYPTRPHRVRFSLKFYYEMPNWRVFGLDVNLYN